MALGLVLRRFAARLPLWALVLAEASFVPAAYGFAFAWNWLVLWLVPLEMWEPFEQTLPAAAALLAVPVALVPARFRARGFAILTLLYSLIIYGDLIYLRYFGKVLPILAFRSGAQIWDVRDVVFDYTRRGDAWLLPGLLGAGLTWIFWPRRSAARGLPFWLILAGDALLVVGCLAVVRPVRGVVDRWLASDRSWRVLNGTDAVQDSGFLVAHVKEIARAVRSLSEDGRISAAELLQVKTFHRLRAAQPTDDADFGIARGTNVILIQVEGMQRWVVGTRYAGQEITPFLNRLRDSSLFFDNVFDETGDSSTSDCEYMVLNSQYPLSQGSVAFRRDANHFVTLAHAFKEASYSSFAGHAYAAGMWNRAVLYPKYGFDAAAFQPEFGAGPKLGWGIGDKPFFERAVPMLRGLPQPFLAMLITLTSHTPYQYIPASEQRLKLGPIEGTSLAGYLQSMRYVDEALALFVEKLRASALLENTTLVIYGDHESRMGFPPAWGRALDLPPETVRRLATRDLATRKIPLFVVLPERLRVAPRLINTIGGQVDIGPTVLHLMGRAAPLSFIGQSLLPEHAGHALRIDGSAVNAEHLFNSHAGGRCETFGDWRAEARAACGDLERSTREELAISWRVTLLDLAGEISGKRPAKALAKR